MGGWEGRGEGRGGNKKGEKRRRPQKLVHTRRNPEKYPAWKTDVIAGGGNTDLCPGRQTLSRRDWVYCMCGAAWSSRWLMMQLTNAEHPCLLVLMPEADILDILCDYQFVFHILDEPYTSHHAWCSRWCSKSALWRYEMWCFIFTTTYLGETDIFHTCINSAKILKIDPDFPMLWNKCAATFLWFTVYTQFIQFLSSLHIYSKDAVFPQ